MRSANIKWFLFFPLVLIYSCRKDIQVNLNDAAPQIVIEGNITNAEGPYQVQITKTVNFSASNNFPPVSGATVKITDNTAGQTDSLVETSAGIYTTQTLAQGMPGHTYQLYVSAEGQTYTASSTMPSPVTLDFISFEHNSGFGDTEINPIPNFQDPSGIANYYTFEVFINNIRFDKAVFAFDDRLSDGRYMTRELRMDSTYIKAGDEISVRMNCVDKPVYDYFNTLINATSGNDFESASPSNPISNISNKALGYFSAHTVEQQMAVAD
jgi:hypothetical protein